MVNLFKTMQNIEDIPEFDSHREVHFFFDRATGLRAFVAIYNNSSGPALGATRMWPYASEVEALGAALRLSKTMAYKCALAGIRHGGAKGVIIGDPKREKTRQLLTEYARRVHELGGRFVTGTDAGLTDEDVDRMRAVTPHVIGAMRDRAESPSTMAALGVFHGIVGCLEEALAGGSLKGKSFAIKGLGKTGLALARLLREGGAGTIYGADVDPSRVAAARKAVRGLKIVKPEAIHRQTVDVFAPCALGDDLSSESIRELHCRFVAGTENNQLAAPEVGDLLHRLGIVYAPDYVVNAGGLIDVSDELAPKGYDRDRVLARVAGIRQTIRKILRRAMREKKPTHRIADQMAEEALRKRNKK